MRRPLLPNKREIPTFPRHKRVSLISPRMKTTTRPSLYSRNLEDLRGELCRLGFPSYLASQVFTWSYRKNESDVDKWSNVSTKAKTFLLKYYDRSIPKILWRGSSRDGTIKYLLQMKDQKSIEAVAIFSGRRRTLCLSSQVGCAVGCVFCHTGTMGFERNLNTEEIIGQYLAVSRDLNKEGTKPPVTNIVYMGQGEPLLNFHAVKKSVEILLEEQGVGFGQRKITLSTSGAVSKIKQLWDFPPVNIAISLHGADDATRTRLMPINRHAELSGLFEAIKTIPLKAHRRITYEYILIDGINDRKEDINGLLKLLNTKKSKINLIPFNEYPQSSFKRPNEEKIRWFQEELVKRGYTCTVRATKGSDILAACGQLKSLSS